jgi:hypothetical protein
MTQTEKQKRYVAHISALLLGEESEYCEEFDSEDEGDDEDENNEKDEKETEKE